MIATSSNEIIYDGTALNLYTFAMAVPATTLALTDRLAIKLYATNSGGKTTTIHTQDSHLCQVITTFSTGITALNGLTAQVQYFQVGTSGTDFNISSTTATHTFNLPDASASARGLITTGTQTIAGAKTFSGLTSFTFSSGTRMDYGPYLIKGSVPIAFSGSTTNIYSDATTNNIVIRDNLSIAKLEFNNSTQTYTFPSVTGTMAMLEGTQTFSGAKTFSDNTIFSASPLFDQSANYKVGASLAGTGNYISMAFDKSGTGSGSTLSMKLADGTSVKSIILDFVGSPATYTYTFPSASGTIALTSNLSSYVPYTGATTNVDLGVYGITANDYKSGAGWGLSLQSNSTIHYQGAGYVTLVSGADTELSLVFGTGARAIFTGVSISGTKTYSLPNATGTIALTSDLSGYLPLTGGIMTGSILLNNNLTISGQLFGTSSYASMLAMSPSNKVLIDNSGRGVIFGGTIGQGAYTYTFPSASGTIALTSDLSGYLPLTGGTLTGALGGTSASFSSTVSATNTLTISSTTNASLVAATNSTTGYTFIDIINNGASGKNYQIGLGGNGAASGYANNLYFDLVGVGNVMTLTSGRNVLIGTTTDSGYKLDVNGTGRFTGSVTTDFVVVGTTAASSGGLRLGTQVAIRARNVANTANIPLIESTASDGVSVSNGALILASTGAATFSSNLNVGGVTDIQSARTVQLTLLKLSTTTLSSDINDEISIDFGRGAMSKYSGRISGYLSNFSTYDGGLKFYSSTSGTLNATPSLTIASTGAATFSSSIQGTSFSNAGLQASEVFNATKSNAGYYVGYFQNTSATGLGLYIRNGLDTNASIRISNAAGTDNTIQLYGNGSATFSSSVTATGLSLITASSTAALIQGTGTGAYSYLSFQNTTTGYGYDIGFGGSATIAPNSFYIYGGSSASVKFSINSTGAAFFSSLGTGAVTATAGVLSTTSDMNLKISDGYIDTALDKILKLTPRYFYWKKESGLPTDLRQLGFYAQEINEILGEEVANTPKTENDKWGIYDRGMIAFLTAAIQEQQKQIEELKLKIK